MIGGKRSCGEDKTANYIRKMKANITQVKIRAAGKMIAELKQGEYVDENCSAVIFCTDSPLKVPESKRLPTCYVQFIDTEDSHAPQAFTREQAALIRDFLMNLPDHIITLYCCCDWGQSRSAGLAAACMTTLGQDCECFFRNRAYTPNLLVYGTMCEALGCPPSADRLQELNRLRNEAGRSGAQESGSIKRILVTGDSTLFSAIPKELFGVSVEICGTAEATIPYTEKELVADKKHMGPVLPGDLLLVMLGVHELRMGFAPAEVSVRMRKYLLWLRYINPSAEILLASPPDTLSDAKVSREQIIQLADCCRCLADDLQIPFVDTLDWNRSTNARSVAEHLATAIRKNSVDHT